MEIGQNVKAMIVYLHVLLGLSHKEVEQHLQSMFNFEISEGMITRSLEEQATLLKPYYQTICENLLAEKGCHYDESSWKVQSGQTVEDGNYVWVKTGMESNEVLFWFGKNRGKGKAECWIRLCKQFVKKHVNASKSFMGRPKKLKERLIPEEMKMEKI